MVPTRDQEIRAPLGVEFAVGRWVTGDATSPIRRIPITDSYVIAPAYEGRHKLEHAEAEAELICRMFNGERIDPASYDNILAQFRARQVSLVHFACHGRSSDETLGQVLELVDRGELTTIELEGEAVFRSYLSAKHPLVFLNACEVGRQQAALTGAGGFPAALIGLGAGAVIAPTWSVKDTIAHQIALDFYNKLKVDREMPLAAIFREIRERAYRDGEDTYAAYCFYGDPLARLWTEPQRYESRPSRP
jgi:CHAT domain-containing protein